MTSHLDSHTTTEFKPEMIPGFLIGNGIPHDKYNTRGNSHARTKRKRQHLNAKTTVHWQSTHGAGHIPLKKKIEFCATYRVLHIPALRNFYIISLYFNHNNLHGSKIRMISPIKLQGLIAARKCIERYTYLTIDKKTNKLALSSLILTKICNWPT